MYGAMFGAYCRVTTDIASTRVDDAIAGKKAADAGKPVPADMCPQRIWADMDGPDLTSVPDLFFASGFWIISERAQAVLEQFELGHGSTGPVTQGVYRKDNETRIQSEYYTWIVGNRLAALSPEESRGLRPPPFKGGWYFFPDNLQDDDVATKAADSGGLNTWVDPTLFKSFS